MTSDNSNLSDGFKLITYKKKYSKIKQTPGSNNLNRQQQALVPIDVESTIRRINTAKEEFTASNVFSSFKALLTEGLLTLNNPKIKEIVCLGLGSFGECLTSKYQLSLLLYLKDRFNVDVYVYDPVFSEQERDILVKFGFKVLSENCEGKYSVQQNSATIFYLPHCPKQLSNNLLWKNWGIKLTNCILIGNSFHRTVENNTSRTLELNAHFITNILPHTTELSVINEFKYFEIFNDTSIHIFPINKLNLLPKEFWENNIEPVYEEDDIEFISKKIQGDLFV